MFFLFVLLSGEPVQTNESSTSLVRPPFAHTMGYYRATPYEIKMLFGKALAFKEPQGIACCKLKADDDPKTSKDDDELTVYCTNSKASQIIYNKALTNIKTYGKFGEGRGEFWWPNGISANPEGDVYVADVENNRVVRLKNDVDSIRWVYTIGSFGCDSSEFSEPWDVAVDNDNQVWVTDKGNNRIQVFGEIVGAGSPCPYFIKQIKNFNAPTAISLINKEETWNYYNDEFLVVIDNKGQRIQKLDLDGRVIARSEPYNLEFSAVGGSAARGATSSGGKDVEFTDCAIDYYGNVWVTDKKNSCIHKFDRFLRYLDSFQDKFQEPRGITIGRRYGQVFILSREAIDYYWIGVNASIKGCYPEIFDSREKGVTITLIITERARVKAKIYNSKNEIVRELIPSHILEPYEHNIGWDAKDNEGNLVKPGSYKIEIIVEPTYSSRGHFKKKLSAEVVCKYN